MMHAVTDQELELVDDCKTLAVDSHNNGVTPTHIPKHIWKVKQLHVTMGHRTTIPYKSTFARTTKCLGIESYASFIYDVKSDVINVHVVLREQNPADIMTKCWHLHKFGHKCNP